MLCLQGLTTVCRRNCVLLRNSAQTRWMFHIFFKTVPKLFKNKIIPDVTLWLFCCCSCVKLPQESLLCVYDNIIYVNSCAAFIKFYFNIMLWKLLKMLLWCSKHCVSAFRYKPTRQNLKFKNAVVKHLGNVNSVLYYVTFFFKTINFDWMVSVKHVNIISISWNYLSYIVFNFILCQMLR